MIGLNFFFTVILLAASTAPSVVEAHGFIKQWGVKGSSLVKAQKTDVKSSSFRAVPSNTGWIGSKCAHPSWSSFYKPLADLYAVLDSKAIACGSSDTPFGKVAAPGGTFFATQGAGQELSVNPGQSVQLVISGNPGQGWPHPKGHVLTYLAQCNGGCSSFDATQGKFFKIQEEKNGIQNTLRPAYDGSVDGNRWVVFASSLMEGDC